MERKRRKGRNRNARGGNPVLTEAQRHGGEEIINYRTAIFVGRGATTDGHGSTRHGGAATKRIGTQEDSQAGKQETQEHRKTWRGRLCPARFQAYQYSLVKTCTKRWSWRIVVRMGRRGNSREESTAKDAGGATETQEETRFSRRCGGAEVKIIKYRTDFFFDTFLVLTETQRHRGEKIINYGTDPFVRTKVQAKGNSCLLMAPKFLIQNASVVASFSFQSSNSRPPERSRRIDAQWGASPIH